MFLSPDYFFDFRQRSFTNTPQRALCAAVFQADPLPRAGKKLSRRPACPLIAEPLYGNFPQVEIRAILIDQFVSYRSLSRGEIMQDIRSRWLTFYADYVGPAAKEMFSYVEKMVIATLIISAGAHVSSDEPAIILFGYLRHSLIGRGVELFGIVLLLLNFLDGFYKLAKLNWHAAYQVVMSLFYIALSVRLVQLILAFRGE
jgi:hypothetical protein